MALIKCPDCGTAVSDAAPACLKCGRPRGAPGVPAPAIPASAPPPKKKVSSGVKAFGCLGLLIVCYAVGQTSRLPKDRWRPPEPPTVPVVAQPDEPKAENPVLPGEKGVLRQPSGGPVTVAVSEDALEKLHQVLHDNDDVGLRRLMAAGLVAQEPDGTRVLALSGGPGVFSGLRKVRILEGADAGTEVVVPYEFLKR